MKRLAISLGVLFVFLVSMNVQAGQPIASQGKIDPRIAPPHSMGFGNSLEEWMVLYWTSFLTGGPSKVGPVYFLPLPDCAPVSGSGTPGDPLICVGEEEVTVKSGTPFILPIVAWIMEWGFENDEYFCDEPLPDDLFGTTIFATVEIDGREILENFEDYYVPPVDFDPLITYAEPSNGYYGACRVQGVAFLSMPLQPGEHTITNELTYIVEELGFGIIYNNTWEITVLPGKK